MKIYKFSKTFVGFLIITLSATSILALSRHTFHTSLTRIDYKAEKKIAEVTVRLFTHDLALVLERRTKNRIDFEKTPDIDKIIFEYVAENFSLKDKKNETKRLKWVGKELNADMLLVYFEIPLENALDECVLQNTIFFESFSEQTNLVVARFDGKKFDLLFKIGDKFKEIKETNKAEKKEESVN